MLTYSCANCRRELEADDAMAGQRIRCPHCGNVEIAPARRASGAAGPAAFAAAPAGPGPIDAETTLLVVHPATLRARPVLGAVLLLLAAGGLGLAVAATFSPGFAGYRWAAWVGAGLVASAGAWLGIWKVATLATRVTITNRRTIVRRGLLSRATRELRHDQVQDIQVTQTLAQRVMNVGRLGLDGGGTDDVEIVVDDLPDPMRLRTIVDRHRGGGAGALSMAPARAGTRG